MSRRPHLEAVLEDALRLPAEDRRRLVLRLDESLATKERPPGTVRPGLELFLRASGMATSDEPTISGDKYRHVADSVDTET